ncbi:NYN domain-containing protein, partial [Candidatus Shapirobacteria bacterium]|nr:NYN domain-containing protein [Candidatus Shapirobacteria bacterium]
MSSGKNLPNKTYVFIDVSNLIYGARRSGGWEVNYQKLSKYLKSRYGATKIFFYAGVK